ncbi:NmrA family NAD(P)-binding protein [Caballeronia sp. LZ002]|uniref:SDR family oxidoreductase n=2 Tax=unclassified Caballeronia TaxID=2646786 RepID=UPI00285B0F4E|nr:NmrA family NAD(P)-binding protein [Caballeronia sp. LZ002]MDR5775098.1 NmrA family NAD(P)-binding protein [Caballeronia sp. LZ002]
MTILVTGSTGVIGTQVIEQLARLDGGVEVRALTRKPADAKFPAHVKPVQGDLSGLSSFAAALADIDTLFLLAPNAADELTQALQALSLAREAGVKGIVYLSVFKGDEYADVPHFTSKHTVERMIEREALPVTVLRPAYFMQNDVRQKEPLLNAGIFGMPIGDKGISMVDVRDIGEAAARELLRREHATDALPAETYDLVGPEAITGTSVAAIWTEALQRPIRYAGDDLAPLQASLKAAPEWLAYDMQLMMRRYQREGAVATATQIERLSALLQRPPRSYRDFARETASSWLDA